MAVVTLDRPAKANALNHALLEEIEAVALGFRDDVDARAVIFAGAGKHFSSGADLGGSGRTASSVLERQRLARIGERATLAIRHMDQITIAAWQGAAVGGGGVLATAMDFRIGAEDCFLYYAEIDIGLNLMWKGLPLIVHLAGPARAKRLVAGGERVTAPTLAEWGVLDAVVPRESLMETAREWAARYAAKSPIATQMIKRSVNAIVSALDASVMHMDVDQNLLAAGTEDARAAAAAHRAKTAPRFRGR